MSTPTLPPLADWEDPDVQLAYEILAASDEAPPNPDEHWEGYCARRIVAEIRARQAVEADRAQRGVPDAEQAAIEPGTWAELKLMMEHSAFLGRLELSDALANIECFAKGTPPAPVQQPQAQPSAQEQPLTMDEIVKMDLGAEKAENGWLGVVRTIERRHGIGAANTKGAGS